MQRTAIRSALCAAAMLLSAHGAFAQNEIYQCRDHNGTTLLTDKPCNAMPSDQPMPQAETQAELLAAPSTGRPVVKEYFTLPRPESGRERGAGKPPVSIPPKIDVATLRAARLALDLRDRVASAR